MIDKRIKSKKDCTGCFACDNICPVNAIEMVKDSEGFKYPEVDYAKCIECSKCINVCPIINIVKPINSPNAYACINNDEKIRLNSSSGGVFTLIAENIIAEGGAVFGAGFNEKFQVQHFHVDNNEELSLLRGSKYVQSNIGDSYKQVKGYLENGTKVLFVGTPCQIAGLKSYLGKAYIDLFCIDFICHGVPSPTLWEKYIEYRKKSSDKLINEIEFRNKEEGWRLFSMKIKYQDDTSYRENLTKDFYMKMFLKDICLRPSCYSCEFKSLNRHSDLTIADFWGIQRILPEYDDDKGVSLVLVNSDFGKERFDEIKRKMKFQNVDIMEAIKSNPSAIKSVVQNPKREKFLIDMNKLDFDRLIKKYSTDRIYIRVLKKLKSTIR